MCALASGRMLSLCLRWQRQVALHRTCLLVSVRASVDWPCGLMDKALVFGTKDCRFESCQGHALHLLGFALWLSCWRLMQCQFAREVKGVDLRSTAGNCAWVRTPQLAFPNFVLYNLAFGGRFSVGHSASIAQW